MTYNIIGSGSSGNAVIIDDRILIDAGMPYSRISPYIKDLQLVLLTHVHSDHFNPATVRKLHEMRPALRFACCEWMAYHLITAGVNERMIDILAPEAFYQYGLITVYPFMLRHNVPNCGWKIWIFPNAMAREPEKVLYATDTVSMEGVEAKDYDLYLLECNHHEDEIQAKIQEKTASGQFSYEVWAAATHLSWEKAMDWLQENGPNSKFIPMHQHVNKE